MANNTDKSLDIETLVHDGVPLTEPETFDSLLSRLRPDQRLFRRQGNALPIPIETKEEYDIAMSKWTVSIYPR